MSDGLLKILAIDDNQDNTITVGAVVEDSFPDAQILTVLNGQQKQASVPMRPLF